MYPENYMWACYPTFFALFWTNDSGARHRRSITYKAFQSRYFFFYHLQKVLDIYLYNVK